MRGKTSAVQNAKQKAKTTKPRRKEELIHMKFTVEKRLLNEAVTNLQRAVSSKTSIPALEGILIRSEENRLILTAYDLEIGMQTELPAIISAPGAIILTAKLFAEIVRRSPDEDITIDVDDRNTATITSGVSCFTIIGMDSAEFPELPKITDADTIKMPQELLKSMIRQTLFAVADSTAKPIHQGSLFKIENGNLDVVSVDGYRLALRREAINYANNTEFVVPGKTLSEVLKLLKDSEGEVEICPSRRHILFRIDNYTVISALLEGEFLDYKSALPKDKKTEVTVSTRTMIESVERVSLLITDRLKSPVRCVIGEDTVKLFCTTTMGRATDQISAEISGDQLEIGFNNKYLLDALRAAETDEVRLQLGGPISPMLVLPKEGDAFSCRYACAAKCDRCFTRCPPFTDKCYDFRETLTCEALTPKSKV